jgi:hypothetical protein
MRTAIVLLLLAFSPLAAGAQSSGAEQRIEAAMGAVRAAGLPASLLQSKVAEGRAKGISPDRIAAAVEQRAQALIGAQQALQRVPGVGSADVAVAADALQAGVDVEIVRQLASDAPANQRAVAIAVLTQLVKQGVPAAQALGRVKNALKKGPEALRTLPLNSKGGNPNAKGAAKRGQPDAKAGQGKGKPPKAGPPPGLPPPGREPGKEKPGKPEKPGKKPPG